MEDEGWTVVGKSGRRRLKAFYQEAKNTASTSYSSDNLPHATSQHMDQRPRRGRLRTNSEREQDLLAQVTSLKQTLHHNMLRELKASAALVASLFEDRHNRSRAEDSQLQTQWQWQSVERMSVLGLGSVESSLPARYQLALGLLLADALLPGVQTPVEVFDPVFTMMDKAILNACGWKVTDQAASICVDRRTLFFMPHCEAQLADKIMANSMSSGRLSDVAILGNSFAAIEEYWSHGIRSRCGLEEPRHVVNAVRQGMVLESKLQSPGVLDSAFNNTSFHLFCTSNE